MKVAVISTGYAGLVTGTCLSKNRVNVVCVDNDPSKIKLPKSGSVQISKPGQDKKQRINVSTL